MFDNLRTTPTFEEYVAMCEGDTEPPPTREEYDAWLDTPAIGEIGVWLGMTFLG